ncbi:MAG TPA: hypothetical protein VI756_09120 [Blastocatellia bacterium]
MSTPPIASIFERFTQSVVPAPGNRVRYYLVKSGTCAIVAANQAYNLSLYDPNLWRNLLTANNIQNPFVFDLDGTVYPGGELGQKLVVPAKTT